MCIHPRNCALFVRQFLSWNGRIGRSDATPEALLRNQQGSRGTAEEAKLGHCVQRMCRIIYVNA